MNGTVELAAERRTLEGKKVHRLREQGLVPAVLYGHGHSISLQIKGDALKSILRQQGTTGLVRLKLPGGESVPALIKQMHFDPVKGHLLHVDLLRTVATEKLKARVPLRFVGEPQVGGADVAIVRPMDAVTVECYPQDLPVVVEVDLSRLDTPHATIRVADLETAEGARIVDPPEEVVASAVATTREKIERLEEAAEAAKEMEEQLAAAEAPEEETRKAA